MTRMDALPPDDSTPESRAWEEWAGKLSEGDWVEITQIGFFCGRTGTVVYSDNDTLLIRMGGYMELVHFAWCDVGPVGGAA